MAKKNKRISSHTEQASSSRIKSEKNKAILDGLVRFSFKFYDPNHPDFHSRDRSPEYFAALLGRLKDLSTSHINEFTRRKSNQTTRFHPIDFTEDRVKADGFGMPGWDMNDDAWQFSLGANENGRVHGFLIEDVFYIVWLDPNHRLYS